MAFQFVLGGIELARAFLGIGSNIGNRRKYLDEAVKILSDDPRISNIKASSYYETDPVGYLDQDIFLNQVLGLDTEMTPFELLRLCQSIELELKRERIIRWGPRTIDVDILCYEGEESNVDELILPHPRMTERAFVIVPLSEIAPDLIINNKKVSDWILTIDTSGVIRL